MTKRLPIPKANKGRGWSGVWRDRNVIGVPLPHVLWGGTVINKCGAFYGDKDERYYLCEITIKPILDKLGRPITRKAKR